MSLFIEQMHALDRRRKDARISSDELARECGLSNTTLSRWRHGKQQPTVDQWLIVAGKLDALIDRRAEFLRQIRAL